MYEVGYPIQLVLGGAVPFQDPNNFGIDSIL